MLIIRRRRSVPMMLTPENRMAKGMNAKKNEKKKPLKTAKEKKAEKREKKGK